MSISWDDLVRDAGDAAASFEPLPESDYDLEVLDAKPKMTKDNTKKMYEVKSKVVGGAHGGRFIWDNITLTTDNPNALGFFFRKMAAMGLDANYFASQKPTDEQICATLKGRRFRAKIGQRTWNGNVKNEIKQYFSATASALPPSVAPQPAAAPAPAPAPAPVAAAPQPTYEQPAAPTPAPVPSPVAAQPAPAAQDPWAQPAPVAQPGDPWAAQPQVQAPPSVPAPTAAPEQPAPPPAPVAPEQQAAPAPAPVPPAPAPAPAAQAQPQDQQQQAPPAPPQAPAAPF